MLLFELLTGEWPYPHGTLEEVLARHHDEPPTDIRALRALPGRLTRLVERLLAREPDERPAARSVVSALSR